MKGFLKEYKIILAFFTMLCLIGCAFDLVSVKQVPTKLDTGQPPKNPFVLGKEASADLGTSFNTILKQNTKWQFVGVIPEGDVYKTRDQVLTVEASNIHEAYIVVSSGNLVGFYLPVEKTFAPISGKMELAIQAVTPE
jgi:hypothetical protein